MKALLFSALAFSVMVRHAGAQLDAPGAFSDFAACSHDVCTWVPESPKTEVFHRGELRYFVRLPKDEKQDGGRFRQAHGKKTLLDTDLKDLSASVSVAWSPNSEWFAVTWSDGGSLGTFHTRVFHIQGAIRWPSRVQPCVPIRNFDRGICARNAEIISRHMAGLTMDAILS
jgi:hypothetical protein